MMFRSQIQSMLVARPPQSQGNALVRYIYHQNIIFVDIFIKYNYNEYVLCMYYQICNWLFLE